MSALPFSSAFSCICPVTWFNQAWFNQAFSSQPHSTELVLLRIPSALHFDKSSTVSCSHLSIAFVSVDYSFEIRFLLSFSKAHTTGFFLTHLSVFSSLLNLFLIIILPSVGRSQVFGLSFLYPHSLLWNSYVLIHQCAINSQICISNYQSTFLKNIKYIYLS